MSDLRQRKPLASVDVAQSGDQDHNAKKDQPGRTSTKFSGSIFAALAYLAVGAAYLALKKINGPAPLPDTYGLCSKDGADIYTVDPEKPRVQCIVVEGARLIDRGSMGAPQLAVPFASLSIDWLQLTFTGTGRTQVVRIR